jgi:hypothetical protein
MKSSGLVQKKSDSLAAPIPLSTGMFGGRSVQRQAELEQDAGQRQVGMPDYASFVGNDLRGGAVQAKLTVGAPNDQYEQETDRVAEQVMSMPDTKPAVQREGMPEEEEDPQAKALGGSIQREAMSEEGEEIQAKPLSGKITPLVQRDVMPEEEEEVQAKSLGGSIQREAVAEEEEPIQAKLIQREAMGDEEEEIQAKRSSGGGFEAGGDFESRLGSSKSGGSPLPDDVRSFMEPRFGANFSGVRVHTGSEAVQMNREVGAQAFAHGQDVYFGAGKAPGKDALTAHELTHVVQQVGLVQTKPKGNSQGSESLLPEDACVRFLKFLNSGSGLTKCPLGEVGMGTYIQNGVELQFEANSSALKNYRNIRPVQWAGSDSIWIKQKNPLTQTWQESHQSQCSGPDDPLPDFIARQGSIVAYGDSPGPNMVKHFKNSRVCAVQNFTGWILGEPLKGGSPQKISEVVAWHSIVSLANTNWSEPDKTPSWQRTTDNRSAIGWADTGKPTLF